MAFRKTFIVGDESLNSYGTWLLNAGADMTYLTKFAPCYYDHQTYEIPLGHWENIHLDNGQWKADLVIDGANDEEKNYIRKIENGDLKGASFGLEVNETSEEMMYIKQGQTRATIVKWKPYEISITPTPGNSNASVLLSNKAAGIQLNADTSPDLIEKILPNIHNQKTIKKMDKIALALGLPADATETTILDAVKIVLSKSTQTEALSKHVEDLSKEALTDEKHKFFVELNKISASHALDYLKLHMKDASSEASNEKSAQTKVSDLLSSAKVLLSKKAEGEATTETYDFLRRNNPEKLMTLKRTDPEKFKDLELAYLASRKK